MELYQEGGKIKLLTFFFFKKNPTLRLTVVPGGYIVFTVHY